jgi:hypothetical protein
MAFKFDYSNPLIPRSELFIDGYAFQDEYGYAYYRDRGTEIQITDETFIVPSTMLMTLDYIPFSQESFSLRIDNVEATYLSALVATAVPSAGTVVINFQTGDLKFHSSDIGKEIKVSYKGIKSNFDKAYHFERFLQGQSNLNNDLQAVVEDIGDINDNLIIPPETSTNSALAVWSGTDGRTLADSYSTISGGALSLGKDGYPGSWEIYDNNLGDWVSFSSDDGVASFEGGYEWNFDSIVKAPQLDISGNSTIGSLTTNTVRINSRPTFWNATTSSNSIVIGNGTNTTSIYRDATGLNISSHVIPTTSGVFNLGGPLIRFNVGYFNALNLAQGIDAPNATNTTNALKLGGDFRLYRSSANVGYTPDSLTVEDNLSVLGTATGRVKVLTTNTPSAADSGSILTGGAVILPNPSNTGCCFWVFYEGDLNSVETPAGQIVNYNGAGDGAGAIYNNTPNGSLFLYATGTNWQVVYTSGNWDLI